jgi:hypothetical protein
MKNLNPLYLTEDKILDKELRDAVRTHNNAKKVFKNKFNSYKNGPTFWDFEKLKSWRSKANDKVLRKLDKAINKNELADKLKSGAVKLLKKR